MVGAEAQADHRRALAGSAVDRLAGAAPGLVLGQQPVRLGSRARGIVVATEETVEGDRRRVNVGIPPLLVATACQLGDAEPGSLVQEVGGLELRRGEEGMGGAEAWLPIPGRFIVARRSAGRERASLERFSGEHLG
jgi:hypothetical protein